jgi:prepilin signal peptidase PulO-like enzyme (type II secretory pathway)
MDKMYEWIMLMTDLVVGGLLVVIGGNLGSFLNVVVHRLPRGESVVHGGSRCPSCGSAIRWHDNVPVFGWLVLGGRCRDCDALIAARYPCVEAAGAILLGGVAAAELLSGGQTLPGAAFGTARSGADNLLLRPDPLLIAVAILHGWLLFHLLLGAAVEADGHAIPSRWHRVVLGVTLVAVACWSALLPVGVGISGPAWMEQAPARGLMIAACGGICGAVVGAFSGGELRWGMILVGVSLGWQATVGIAVLRPVVGWLRAQVAMLIPPEAPGGILAGDWVATANGTECATESIPAEISAEPADPVALADPEVETLPEPRPVVRPEKVLPRETCLARLAGPIARQLRGHELPCGDLVVATAMHLVAWRWLWSWGVG